RYRVDPDLGAAQRVNYLSHGELLGWSTIVPLHVPLTDETYRLMWDAALFRMQPGSVLIITSRGAVVDEHALRTALERGHVAAAGLDVREHEVAGGNPVGDLPQ